MENFAGLQSPYSDFDQAKIAVLPVPYDATSTWIRGSEKGPEALLDASVTLEWYDTETQTEVYKHGIHTLPPVTEQRTPELLCDAVEAGVGGIIDANKFPVTIGGNHTVSIGAFRAVAKRYNNLTILQFDAHSDLRRFYEGSELNHACVMNQAKQLCPITQVGIRSMCIEETDNYDPKRIFWGHRLWEDKAGQWEEEALATLSENVYITIDLDAFDPSVLPSTGTPEPGGMYYYQMLFFIRKVMAARNVVGFDIVELCPNTTERSSDYLAARLIYQMLTYKFLNK